MRSYKIRKSLFSLVITFQFIFTTAVFSGGIEDIPMFIPVEIEKSLIMQKAGEVIQFVKIHQEWIKSMESQLETGWVPKCFQVNIAEKTFNLEITKFEKNTHQDWACIGIIENQKYSRCSMGYYNNTISMKLYSDLNKQKIHVQFLGRGIHKIVDIGNIRLPTEQHGHIHNKNSDNLITDSRITLKKVNSITAVDSPIVELGIIWSENAEKEIGGESAMMAEITRLVLELNHILEQSLIKVRWRLVYTAKTDYDESSMKWDDYLTNFSTAKLKADTIASMRALQAIDHICLVQGNSLGYSGYGGLGRSVVKISSFNIISPTFFHELGHGMRCNHPRDDPYAIKFNEAGDFNYGFTFTDKDGDFQRTVMFGVSDWEFLPYFSNPKIQYKGVPLGFPAGSVDSLGKPNAADNARWINEKGGQQAADYSRPGLVNAIDRKYIMLPPEGIQEFRIRLGNTSPILIIPISKVVVNLLYEGEVVYISDGGVEENNKITWFNYGGLNAGQVGKATIGKSLYFKVKMNKGDTVMPGPMVFTQFGIGTKTKAVYANPTYIDNSLAGITEPHIQKKPLFKPKMVFLNTLKTIPIPRGAGGLVLYDLKGKRLWTYRHETVYDYVRVPAKLRLNGLGYVRYWTAP